MKTDALCTYSGDLVQNRRTTQLQLFNNRLESLELSSLLSFSEVMSANVIRFSSSSNDVEDSFTVHGSTAIKAEKKKRTPVNAISVTWFVLQVCMETQRFERLMEYFKNEDNNIDFMVCTHARTHTSA